MTQNRKKTIYISQDADVIHAVFQSKEFSKEIGFQNTDQVMISTAVSELARNIIKYAKEGEVTLKIICQNLKKGIEILAIDKAPGIQDIDKALDENYSTGGTIGIGLPGTKRIMDDFHIESEPGKGTTIMARKWIK